MNIPHRFVRQLRGIAVKLTGDHDLQKDLLQEMFLYLGLAETASPGQTDSWYIQGCWYRGLNYLDRGRSVNSIKRQENLVPLELGDDGENNRSGVDAVDPVDLRSELITRDLVDQMIPQLSDRQQQILSLLMHGFRIREIAREMRVSHPTVLNQRKKIACIASRLLADADCLPVVQLVG